MTQKEKHIANAAKRRIEEDPLVELAASDYLAQLSSTREMIATVMAETETELGVKLKRTKSGKFAIDAEGEVIVEEGDTTDFWKLATTKQEALFEDYPLTNKPSNELIAIFMDQRKCPTYRRADVERKILELFVRTNPDKTVEDVKKELNPFELDHREVIKDLKSQIATDMKEIRELYPEIEENLE